MTFNTLYKRIAKMSPAQRKCKVRLYEGCSGNWDTLQGIIIPRKDEYREGEEDTDLWTGEYINDTKPEPVVRKGQPYGVHDH